MDILSKFNRPLHIDRRFQIRSKQSSKSAENSISPVPLFTNELLLCLTPDCELDLISLRSRQYRIFEPSLDIRIQRSPRFRPFTNVY